MEAEASGRRGRGVLHGQSVELVLLQKRPKPEERVKLQGEDMAAAVHVTVW